MGCDHGKYALDYDEQVEKLGCYLAEALFGLCYEYVTAGETLLDVGIGTGISSQLFHRAGLRIFGMDSSAEMLALCRQKGISQALTQQDVLQVPWPYNDQSMNHIICCGLLHFLAHLESVFEEASRIIMKGGLFAFTIKVPRGSGGGESYTMERIDGYPIYSHTDAYFKEITSECGFQQFREISCFVRKELFKISVLKMG